MLKNKDSDYIIIGEKRDSEEIYQYINAANYGHLSQASPSFSGAVEALNRLKEIKGK